MATKTSILIFYLRMSKNTQQLLRIASYVTLAIVNVDGVVLTLLNTFQCRPIRAAFDSSGGKCFSIVTLYLASAPVNVFTDLAILCLPLPVLTAMRLPQRQKTVLVFTFALGIFVTVVDIVRVYYLQQASVGRTSLELSPRGNDVPWNASLALMWSAVEVNVGIICACIPTLKPLAIRILPAVITDRVAKRNSIAVSDALHNEPHRRLSSVVELMHEKDIQTLPPVQYHDSEKQMDMMDFLTTPGMDPAMTRSATVRTHVSEDSIFFGFVNIKKPRSMLKLKDTESIKYCLVVTILFFLWGFSYGLLNILNNKISGLAGQSMSQTLGLGCAYFGAYFCGPLTVGQFVLRRWGFKATFITGLCIYGTGTLMFWPSAVLLSYAGFIISNFAVGFGLSILETAANPFLALCGPNVHAEYRLLLAQGVQAVATVCSQALAEKALFSDVSSLVDVQWTYLAIALFDVILALFFYYMPLPEASDADLQTQTLLLNPINIDDKLRLPLASFNIALPLIYTSLGLAIFSQFIYVAAQECMSTYFQPLITALTPDLTTLTLTRSNYLLLAHALFAISRFTAGFACLYIAPRTILLACFLLTLLFSILVVGLPSTNSGNSMSVPTLLFFLSEGPLFPLIFAIGLRCLGNRTKIGASMITAATSGGAIWPFIMWASQQVDGLSVQRSFGVVVALVGTGCAYPLWLNVFKDVRTSVDPVKEDQGVLDGGVNEPVQKRRLSSLIEKGRAWGRGREDEPSVEHKERT